ncbi:MAG: hypothetical protein JW746_08580 [Candidatus Krumholzibacteriota bacterium]|nr:hypothetical protein [Candidatus Krumholzibacteriota bacterium]
MKKILFLFVLMLAVDLNAGVSVTEVDFLAELGLEVNGAGPLLLRIDHQRHRLISVNTLSSSVTVIDLSSESVFNLPIKGRACQHLKSESLTIGRESGNIYLIGIGCFYIVDAELRSSRMIKTRAQFESIAVDEKTGNVFLAGRESRKLGFYKASKKEMKMLDWLETEEPLVNLNATPPPPVRKVIADGNAGEIIAVDGLDPAIYRFDGNNGNMISSRRLSLSSGGRWHLGGYNEMTRSLFIVTETSKREVIEAARIGAADTDDLVIPLPGYTEGVGIVYNPDRNEIYIPYDNHPSVHVAGFEEGGSLGEIMIPAYGNDAAVIDRENDLLYVASWAFSEIDIIDLEKRELRERITEVGLIPHMFTIEYDPVEGLLYFPRGASAVNGTFGATVSTLDPDGGMLGKIYTGWAPIDLIEIPSRESFLVFNSEDQFAEVWPDGSFEFQWLPYDYPVTAAYSPEGDVYLSYGPHQSYWPTVYIWDAKNGIITIDADDLEFYDRRIPRQAQQIVLGKNGTLFFTQNNWGKEEQFIGILEDQIRLFDPGKRIRLGEEVERETTQRILRYDPARDRLYLVRAGEKDTDRSVLQVIDPGSSGVAGRVEAGLTATDLIFDDMNIYISNFDSGNISVINKDDLSVREIKAGRSPLRLAFCRGIPYVIDHLGNDLRDLPEKGKIRDIPNKAFADNIFEWNGRLVITSHNEKNLFITRFDPERERFDTIHRLEYPFGDTKFDSGNVSFYMRGQFGDILSAITEGRVDSKGRLWISDFLSGRVFILEED